MNTGRQNGFTLWELLMTLLVAGILLGIGVPNVMEFQRNGAMTAAANNFVTGMLMARNEAVKRQTAVTVCLSDNPLDPAPACAPNAVADSTRGFIVFVDDDPLDVDGNGIHVARATDGNAVVDAGANELVLMQSAGFTDTIRVSADSGHITYGPSGFPQPVVGLGDPLTLLLYCDDRGRRVAAGNLSSARLVRVDRPGRAQVVQETAAIDPLIAGLGATCP
jgi:type IV fimbrial biogenesis protein FimT